MSATLPELLSARAPDGIVLVDRNTPIAARRLEHESRSIARGLLALGIKEGDRVAIWLPNVPAWVACFFACAQIGAIVVAVNTRFRVNEIEDVLGRSGAKVLVVWPGFRGIDFDAILRAADPAKLKALAAVVAYTETSDPPPVTIAGLRTLTYESLIRQGPYESSQARADSGLILFTTSGTTRAPKFALHNQSSIATHALHVAQAFGFDAPDATILLTIPLCGTFGLTSALGAIAGGRPLVMLPTFEAETAAGLIQRHTVTHFPAVGDIVAQLLAVTPGERPYPSVRLVIGARAGQAAPAEARGLRLVGVYGASEVQAMVSRHSEHGAPQERELGGGALIAPGAAVRARDPQTGIILPHGRSGELEFRMPSQMVGYFGDEEATRAAFTDDGFVRSGDLGYTVEGGFIFQSRIADVLRLSGFLVNPLEIEDVISSHPSVLASQVVGVEGPSGAYPVAFAIPRNGTSVDEEEVIAHCAHRIAGFKVPKRVFSVEAFPVTHSANGTKVQKARLREMASQLLKPGAGGDR